MRPSRLLVANRGEIAVRVIRAATEMGIYTVAVYSEDDDEALHTRMADESVLLPGAGPQAYLSIEQMLNAAAGSNCDAVHPGYGFLSENATFALACRPRGLTFVGPRPEMLALFGDKVRARAVAQQAGVPVLRGTQTATSLDEASAFFQSLGAGGSVMVKAVAGGGGRGMREVERLEDLKPAMARCRSEALAAFGNGDVYLEELMRAARHIEVQIIGDATGAVVQAGERDCTIQRRHQKLIEIAPSPGLPDPLRTRIQQAALTIGRAARYDSLGTIEFLVDADPLVEGSRFAFIEANARLQVEHTVTEEVMGLDLVRTQIELAGGATLAELGLAQEEIAAPRGSAMQLRINLETIGEDGVALPAGGVLAAFSPPSGPGVRVDTFGYPGFRTSPRFDSLLAKLIVHTPRPRLDELIQRAQLALSEFKIDGAGSNIGFLESILAEPDFRNAAYTTRYLETHLPALLSGTKSNHRRRYVEAPHAVAGAPASRAGVRIDTPDPLAVLSFGQASRELHLQREPAVENGSHAEAAGAIAVASPMQGTVVAIEVTEGDSVAAGQLLVVMEAMKMEHEIRAPKGGVVQRIAVTAGETLYAAVPLLYLRADEGGAVATSVTELVDLDFIRADLEPIVERHRRTLDEARPDAVARRRRTGQRTARENVNDLCDPGTFVEYGPLVVANQRSRRSLEELIEKSPADGMITGVGSVNSELFPDPVARCAVMAYDYTVFAGTQGGQNHRKTDRMIDIAEHGRMPMVLFAEGGGGRPGDDSSGSGGQRTFARFAQLSGLVPMIGITSGRCFAGNASLLGCCDVIIATANSNIGMGGPAMIEGGGLGVFAPEEIGPMSVQVPSGVVDIAVADEAEAVATAKRYLSFFQGRIEHWEAPDQRVMRRIIPENRLRAYNVRRVIETLADTGSMLELRAGFGLGMVTALVRVEGRPLGVVSNNPLHLGGAIDADGADKASRFMQLCDAFDIPLLYLCDTPGIMVGPEIEKTGLVRHSSRMFVTGSNISVPFFTIILRKAYGLGAIAMAGGSYKVPFFSVTWPTGEFWGMGIEGSVKLGYRAELAAIADPEARKQEYDRMVAAAYERSRAIHSATGFGTDDAIDPADSRGWIAGLLKSIRLPAPRTGKKRASIDSW